MSMIGDLTMHVSSDGAFNFMTKLSVDLLADMVSRKQTLSIGEWKCLCDVIWDGNKDGFVTISGNVNDKPEHLN